jgi:aspartyl-tRNA(Asn)/glutamyl-tRNA(Gln) amidotransferase subunit A
VSARVDPADAWRLGASELLAHYRAGTLTPRQALEASLQRIAATQPVLNAFVALRADAARTEADASTQRWRAGAPCGALDGLPLAVKDNIPSADLPTTWGSAGLREHRPAHDEGALARARTAGAIVVGKTNCPEFTLEGYTANPLFGVTRNPWNPALTPGGSSGGSVAAVAAGLVPLALGTDGGGSTRRPASHTGLVGFKPSIGAIARLHALPPLLLDFEVIGPIARSVADVQLLFDALAGPHAADRRSHAAAAARKALPERCRVLYVPTLDAAPVDAQIAASCRAGVERLAALGHQVDEGPLPLALGPINQHWPRFGQIGLAWLFEREPGWRDGASERFRQMAAAGAALPAPLLWDMVEAAEQLRRDAARLFERIDLIVTPSAAALPWPADQVYPPTIDGQPVGPRGHAIFTGWVNAAGLPALALPTTPSAEGLPIGVQLIAHYGCDAALLELAARFEAAAPQGWRWPPV